MRYLWIFASVVAGMTFSASAISAQEFAAIDQDGNVQTFDPITGCATGLVATIPGVQEINAVAKRPSDGMIFIAGGWTNVPVPILYQIDPANWSIVSQVPITSAGSSFSIRGMAFDSSGTLYLSNWDANAFTADLFTCDETTGAATYVGYMFTGSIQALAYDEVNSRLVGWSPFVGAAISGIVHIDPATGAMVDPNPGSFSSDIWEVQGLCFDNTGRLMSIGLWPMKEFDPVTGAQLWSSSCGNSFYYRGIEYIEPTSLHLALNGNCPGAMTAELLAGTPGGSVAVAWSFGNVGFTLNAGPCAGTTVGLSSPATLVGIYTLDAQGAFSLGPVNLNAGACGNIWVQAVDLTTCDLTSPVQP